MSICKFGIRRLLPDNIDLISGPGCPVCVTSKTYIDKAIEFCKFSDAIVVSFGDMLKVPGSYSSLREEKAKQGRVKIVYSALDALDIAEKNPDKNIIFLGIGFETTTPTVAAALLRAKKKGIGNFFVYSAHKVILPAMVSLAEDRRIDIDGFICPAHVSAIIGVRPYEIITRNYKIPCVIVGFEPLDILQGILMIIEQINSGNQKVENQYQRVVKNSGNKKALSLMRKVFVAEDSEWRGLGIIPKSGLSLSEGYSRFSPDNVYSLPKINTASDKGCICGSILKGIKKPSDCRLFGKRCTPERPAGACMVSSEGTCAAHYRYG